MKKYKKNKGLKYVIASLGTALMLVSMLVVEPQTVSAAPFSCDSNFYWVVDNGASTQLYTGDPATNDLTNPVGPTSAVNGYNAIGYNMLDNFIWGVSTDPGTSGRLVRIHSDGAAELAHPTVPTGLPTGGGLSYEAGAFDDNGVLWANSVNGQLGEIYGIDVANNTATQLILSDNLTTERIVDFAFVGGYLYTTSGGPTNNLRRYRIDLTNGDVDISNPMTGMDLDSNFMFSSPSLWSTADGRIYMYYAQGTVDEDGIYEIINYDTPDPAFVLRNNIDGHPSGDGASCTLADSPFSIDAVDDDYTTTPVDAEEGGVVGDIFNNDTLYDDPFDPADITFSLTSDGGLTGVNIDPVTGQVEVPPGSTAGSYTLEYQICDELNPDVCDSANVFLVLVADEPPAPPPTPDSPDTAASGDENLVNTGQGFMITLIVGITLSIGAVLATSWTGKLTKTAKAIAKH